MITNEIRHKVFNFYHFAKAPFVLFSHSSLLAIHEALLHAQIQQTFEHLTQQ